MATTTRPRTVAGGAENARGSARERTNEPEGQYDLLTAALLGIAVGAGAALLLRRGPSGGRPLTIAAVGAGRGARWAGEKVVGAMPFRRRRRGLLGRIPVDAIRDEMGDMLESARDAVADLVESELRDLRKAIRRQRKRVGL